MLIKEIKRLIAETRAEANITNTTNATTTSHTTVAGEQQHQQQRVAMPDILGNRRFVLNQPRQVRLVYVLEYMYEHMYTMFTCMAIVYQCVYTVICRLCIYAIIYISHSHIHILLIYTYTHTIYTLYTYIQILLRLKVDHTGYESVHGGRLGQGFAGEVS